jgi:hypothetical protein
VNGISKESMIVRSSSATLKTSSVPPLARSDVGPGRGQVAKHNPGLLPLFNEGRHKVRAVS